MGKPKTYEEASQQLDTAREKLATEKDALREFKRENKIKRDKPVEDAAIAKKLEAAEKRVEKAREAVETAKEAVKELKPRKERSTKYEYPADCVTDKDKKKYRAKIRRESKKEESGEEKGKEAKAEKPEKKKVAKKKPVATEED